MITTTEWLNWTELNEKSASCSVMSNSLWPMDCSPPGYSVHGIIQAQILEWVAIPFSRGSSQASDWTWVSCIAGSFFTIWTARGAPFNEQKWFINEPLGKLSQDITTGLTERGDAWREVTIWRTERRAQGRNEIKDVLNEETTKNKAK